MSILDDIVKKKQTKLPKYIFTEVQDKPKPFLHKINKVHNKVIQVIAEIKRGSPSLGLKWSNLDIVQQANYYQENGANAISVLTEEEYFYGSVDDLKTIKKSVNLPILRKDFIFTEEQVYESRVVGADAILLICSILNLEELQKLFLLAKKLELSVIVEAHNEIEVEMALSAGVDIIGINNRNLKTFKTSLDNSFRLVNKIPDNIIKVSESGIANAVDVESLKDAGFDAILVGESFLRNPEFLNKLG